MTDDNWLKRSLDALKEEMKTWPKWKRDSAKGEKYIEIPDTESTDPKC